MSGAYRCTCGHSSALPLERTPATIPCEKCGGVAVYSSAAALGAATIGTGAAALLRELARRNGVPERVYLEALLHYAGSIERRPGSWEASQPFDFACYDDREPARACADRWFDDARQYAFAADGEAS